MNLIVIDLVLAVVAVLLFASGLRVVRDDERLALMRLGRNTRLRRFTKCHRS